MKKILYTKFFNQKIDEKVDVILSPEFYWIKKIDIPIKSLKDAKKIAKTLFKLEGDYFYDALKIGDKFFAVAIDKHLKINIPEKYINSIRIAQSELYPFECIKIDENHYIRKIDNMLFCFPTPAQNCVEVNEALEKTTLSNKKFNLVNRIEIDKKIIFSVLLIFLFINIPLILNAVSIKKEINRIQNETFSFLDANSLPHTTFQLNSILNSLKEELKYNDKIKKDLEIISKTPLNRGDYFKKLTFDGKSFYLEIVTSKNLDGFFKRYFKISSVKEKNLYKVRLF